jgi:hypothetical protein
VWFLPVNRASCGIIRISKYVLRKGRELRTARPWSTGSQAGVGREEAPALARTSVLPFVALCALFFATGIDRFSIRIFETNFRLELMAGGLVFLYCVLTMRSTLLLRLGWIEICLGGWLAVSLVSSALFSPRPASSLKLTVLLAGLVTIYLATRLLLNTAAAVEWGALLYVAVGAGVCFVGLVNALAFRLIGAGSGISFNRLYDGNTFSALPMVHSTIWEPNIFGSYALSVAVLASALALAPSVSSGARWRLGAAIVLALGGVVLSLTRTVWAVAALVLLLLWLSGVLLLKVRFATVFKQLVAPSVAGLVMGVLVAQTLPPVRWATEDPSAVTYGHIIDMAARQARNEPLQQGGSPEANQPAVPAGDSALGGRIGELESATQAPTLVMRQIVVRKAIEGWLQRPLLGWGTDTYRFVVAPAPHEPSWIPNVELHVLFDTGLVGLLFFGGALALIAWRAIRSLRTSVGNWTTLHFALLGLLFVGGGLFLTYQLTDATWLGFTWVLLGLMAAGVSEASRLDLRPQNDV